MIIILDMLILTMELLVKIYSSKVARTGSDIRCPENSVVAQCVVGMDVSEDS